MAKARKRKTRRKPAVEQPKAPPQPSSTEATEPELKAKRKLFVTEYLVDLNGTQAAIRAGYSARSAYSTAHDLLRNPEIAEAIDKELEERGGITRTRIVNELARVAFADIRDVVTWGTGQVRRGKRRSRRSVVKLRDSSELGVETAAAIAEVSQAANGTLRVKLHDKMGALDKLGRTLRMFKDHVEHTGAGGGPIETKDVSARELVSRRIDGIASRIAKKGGDRGAD